ncbi:hypothetical protein [Tolypothrix sp. PCC 7601]|uniref:hypothetical protein n=1 Tax=Tolypothrix sp. PCC 7601 TaxID=1188 RepID=UPI0012D80BB2|nr:hypothetical protein [Tolypothrix sp. PCC 7601]UYD25822.1 hypothetical protein HGR01_31565 [Tolypothrix sp. PCC 7712]
MKYWRNFFDKNYPLSDILDFPISLRGFLSGDWGLGAGGWGLGTGDEGDEGDEGTRGNTKHQTPNTQLPITNYLLPITQFAKKCKLMG